MDMNENVSVFCGNRDTHCALDDCLLSVVQHLAENPPNFMEALELSTVFEQTWSHVSWQCVESGLVRVLDRQKELSGDAARSCGDDTADADLTPLMHRQQAAAELLALVRSLRGSSGGERSWIGSALSVVGIGSTKATEPEKTTITKAVEKLFSLKWLDDLSPPQSLLAELREELEQLLDDAAYQEARHGFANDGESQSEALLQENKLSMEKDVNVALCRADSVRGDVEALQRDCSADPANPSIPERLASIYTSVSQLSLKVSELRDTVAKWSDNYASRAARFKSVQEFGEEDDDDAAAGATEQSDVTDAASPVSALKFVARGLRGVIRAPFRAVRHQINSHIREILRHEVFVGAFAREQDEKNKRALAAMLQLDSASSAPELTPDAIASTQRLLQCMTVFNGSCANSVKFRTLEEFADVLPSDAAALTAEDLAAWCQTQVASRSVSLQKAARLSNRIESSRRHQESAKRTRDAMTRLGGHRHCIETNDNASLDGMFMGVDRLLQAIQAAGGEFVSVKHEGTDAAAQSGGVMFRNFTERVQEVLADMTYLGFGNLTTPLLPSECENTDGRGGRQHEWVRMLLPRSVLAQAEQELTPEDKSPNIHIVLPWRTSFSPGYSGLDWARVSVSLDGDRSQMVCAQRGTVLLTSGAIGVYEAQKREVSAFLLRGVNVMCFNYRGYGLSTGSPTEDSMLTDITAAYQRAVDEHGVVPSKMVVKSLCMSGIAGTHVAGAFPGTNLLLDQTYSDFRKYLEREVLRTVRSISAARFLPSYVRSLSEWLAAEYIKRKGPQWNVSEAIRSVKGGHVGFLVTDDDVNTPKAQAIENVCALRDSGHESVHVFELSGEHAALWIDAPRAHVSAKDIQTDSFPRGAQLALAAQAPMVWNKLKRLVSHFHATRTAEMMDESILLDIVALLSGVEVLHEEAEVALHHLRWAAAKLADKCSKTEVVSQPSLNALVITRQRTEDVMARCESEAHHSFGGGDCEERARARADFPGRAAIDTFLEISGNFDPIFCTIRTF